ncbi:dynamin family protein [Pseudomonas sp. LG1E9]|uniref:dynamin family protein n=1 Tax=Pseudomonas sp. LG1E9 TaxID=2219057 RepID=UPI002113F950|nr:dynamin family protein [Pseudomonas sp. LG1E9]
MTQQPPMSHVLSLYDDVDELCAVYNPSATPAIRKMVASRKASAAATIMVYGVFNAGKSTLINALLGAELAQVADTPETYRIQGYRWGDFEILDTPGIDAPQAHEQVTREQLYGADVVIFVVNPLGVVEEEATLSALLELVERNKQIFLVLNRKNPLEPLEAERIKDQLRERIQQMARARGLPQVLQAIPILEVNARSALKAKLEHKSNLLQNSGFPKFESELNQFFASIEQRQIVAGVATDLSGFIDETLDLLDQQRDQASSARIDAFYAQIARREIDLRSLLKASIQAKSAGVAQSAIMAMHQDAEGAQAKIDGLIRRANEQVCGDLDDELKRLALDASQLLDEMFDQVRVQQAGVPSTGTLDIPDASAGQPSAGTDSTVDMSLLEAGVRQAGGALRTEHVVTVMKLGKEWLPTLFKGIGPVTMGKVAEQVVGKVLPAIGVVYQVGKLIYTAFAGDPEQQRLEEQSRLEQQQRERRDQAIKSLGDDIAWEFSRALTEVVEANIKSNFALVNDKLKTLRDSLSQTERKLSEDRALLVQCQVTLDTYV